MFCDIFNFTLDGNKITVKSIKLVSDPDFQNS